MHGKINFIDMIDLIGKNVEIYTVDIIYTGKLVEIGEEEVYIESTNGGIVIPTEKIAGIREKKD
ncbi:MAG: hypothetical protein HXY47_04200 [Nitrospirae bacterium]|nr:hypothetical protein [Nitrospirota bacterium]